MTNSSLLVSLFRGRFLPQKFERASFPGVELGMPQSGDTGGWKKKPRYSKRARLWLSVLATLLQLVGLVMVYIWAFPALGINIAWPWIAALGAALVAWDAFTYAMGTRALDREPVADLESMVGSRGRAETSLHPEGAVRVRGELWHARSVEGVVDKGAPVEVVGQEGLTLRVKKVS
ncbi:MAG: hypothetical protein HYY32_05170 [Chloroflexi bacterium]|nr:hypothetical protein [Chloroflexota bacterium]